MTTLVLKTILILAVAAPVAAYFGLWLTAKNQPGPGDVDWQFTIEARGWSKFMRLDGVDLHYLDAGSGRPVLLIHGFGDSVYTWRNNIDALLASGRRVLAVDLPGLGLSEAPDDFSRRPSDLANFMVRFLDRLGLDRVDAVGSSLGGNLALAMAVNHPDRVRRLALLGPLCYRDGKYITYHALVSSSLGMALLKPIFGPWVFRVALNGCFHDHCLVTERMVAQKCKPFNRAGFVDALARLGSDYLSDDLDNLSRRYGEIQAPVLIVWGKYDLAVPPKRYARRLNRDLPQSELVILDRSGHLPHQEQPGKINDLLTDYFSGEDVERMPGKAEAPARRGKPENTPASRDGSFQPVGIPRNSLTMNPS